MTRERDEQLRGEGAESLDLARPGRRQPQHAAADVRRVQGELEAKKRADEQARLLAHEKEMAAIAAKQRKGVHPMVFVVLFLLVGGGLAGGWFGYLQPYLAKQEQQRIAAEAAAEERARAEAAARAEAEAAATAAAEARAARLRAGRHRS